jgi:hypothetical protein
VNAVETAAREMLIALVIDSTRGDGDISKLETLRERYCLKISDQLLAASIEPWLESGLLIDAGSMDGPAACIKPGRFGASLSIVLDYLQATTFEVSWEKEEILTDANSALNIPCPIGWKLFYFEKTTSQQEPTPAPTASASPIHIHNVFSPNNTQTVSLPTASDDSRSVRVGWWNVAVAIAVGAAAIFATLWVGGKL